LALASTSPRRSALLIEAGIPFVLAEPGPEPESSGTPRELAANRARSKARFASRPMGCAAPLLGVDTVVDLDGRELPKPTGRAEAELMLRSLAGRRHFVHTAHCMFDPSADRMCENVVSAIVECGDVVEAELRAYLDSGDWRGKAGAYGIQDGSQRFLRLVEGPFDAVMGMHVESVLQLLREVASR
jgi:septum formation protein